MARRLLERPTLKSAPDEQVLAAQLAPWTNRDGVLLQEFVRFLEKGVSTEELWGGLLVSGFKSRRILEIWDLLEASGQIVESTTSLASILSDEEFEQYRAQMRLLDDASKWANNGHNTSLSRGGVSQQAALKGATVMLIGTGLVGSAIATSLAAVGVGTIIVVPEIETLPTTQERTLRSRLLKINPTVTVSCLNQFNGFLEIENHARPDIVIYSPDNFSLTLCEHLNSLAVVQKISYIPHVVRGLEVTIGPLVRPGQSACYACYLHRRHISLSARERQLLSESYPGALRVPLGIDWTTIEIIKHVTGIAEPITKNRILRLNFVVGVPEVHPVLKMPRCSICGVHKDRPSRQAWTF